MTNDNAETQAAYSVLLGPRCLNCDLDMKELSPTQFVWACPNCNFRVSGDLTREWWDKYAQSTVRYDENGNLERASDKCPGSDRQITNSVFGYGRCPDCGRDSVPVKKARYGRSTVLVFKSHRRGRKSREL